jgi:hypothetical protein
MTFERDKLLKKIILHCGSSKNGSTALQSFLLKNYSQLVGLGIFPLSGYYLGNIDVTNGNSVYDVNCIFFNSDRAVSPVEIHNSTTSFGIPYEGYKQFIFEKDSVSLKSLLNKIKSAMERVFAYNDIHTLIISAEAFETSLCLKDPIFKKILKKLSKEYEVEVIYYVPDPARHAISSWLEWGWIECIQYSDWVSAYSVMSNRSEFYARRSTGVRYFTNLLNTFSWFGYWHTEKNIKYSFIEYQKDIVNHFFKVIINVDCVKSGFNFELSKNELNIGWPKSLITTFPLFFNFFCQEYAKFDVTRQLMRDKEFSFDDDLFHYNEITKLTAVILGEVISHDSGANTGSQALVNSAKAKLSDIFESIDIDVVSRVIKHLCDTFYFYHSQKFKSAPSSPHKLFLQGLKSQPRERLI